MTVPAPVPEPPAPVQTFTWDDVQRSIAEAVAQTRDAMAEDHARDMETLRAQVYSAPPISNIPEHGAGPGTTVRDTWSQAEQDAARAAANAA